MKEVLYKKGEEFGAYLKDLRKSKGLTITELSKLSGVSHPYISQIENGKRGVPSPDILDKLAEPLDTSLLTLMVQAGHITHNEKEEILDNHKKVWEMLGSQVNEINQRDIRRLLRDEEPIYYNGHALNEQERQRVLDMLQILFPQEGGTEE